MNSGPGADRFPPFIVNRAKAGTVIYPPGGTFGPRVQQDLQLVLLHTGGMCIHIDGTAHPVPTGHVALLKPGKIEYFEFAGKEETWHRWIEVKVGPLPEETAAWLEQLPLYIPISDKMNQLTDLMLTMESNEDGSRFKEVLCSLGRSAVLLFLTERQYMDKVKHKHPAVLIAKEEIHRRFAEELDLTALSLCTNTSPEHLIRLFRRDEGVTPTQYLWKYRVMRGLELLRSTGLGIGEIADRVGFKTSYHFARTIKQHTKKTPTEVRRESWHNSSGSFP